MIRIILFSILRPIQLVFGIWMTRDIILSYGIISRAKKIHPNDKKKQLETREEIMNYIAESTSLIWLIPPGTAVIQKFMSAANESPAFINTKIMKVETPFWKRSLKM